MTQTHTDSSAKTDERSARSSGGIASATLRALRANTETPAEQSAAHEDAIDASAPAEVAETDTAVLDTAVLEDDADTAVLDTDIAAPDNAAPKDDTDTAPPVLDKPRTHRHSAPRTAPQRRRRTSPATLICAGVAFVALIFAVVAGVVWWTAGHNDQRSLGSARDQVSTDARLAIATVNTSDYRHPDSALSNWLQVSTGTLHGEFADSRTSATKLLSQAKTVTKATVLDAAVTKLDTTKGTATVIASVNVSRKPATGSATTIRNRFRASMKLVGGEWKLDDLTVVPVALS